MSSVGIRELKINASAIVRRVREHGEVIDITDHGEVVARLIPARPAATAAGWPSPARILPVPRTFSISPSASA